MTTYDDKTSGIIESDGRFILPEFKPCADVIFKASYIVASNVKCDGKISALFDLVVLGDVEATELDVKGRFVCLGRCDIISTIVVQNEIWAEDIRTATIETNDRIVVQEIDADTIIADGSIVVGKILAVEKIAKSEKNIICGETAYGAGKIAANTIITGEPLDLDGGEESIVSPIAYANSDAPPITTVSTKRDDFVHQDESEPVSISSYKNYLDLLIAKSAEDETKNRLARWKDVLGEAESIVRSDISGYKDIALLINLAEIAISGYFKNWDWLDDLFDVFETHFKSLVQNEKESITCSIGGYREWLHTLDILNRYGDLFDSVVYNVAFELVVANLGLKARFVSERLKEKGWKAHAE